MTKNSKLAQDLGDVRRQLNSGKTRGRTPRPLAAEEIEALEKKREGLLAQMKEAAKERGVARVVQAVQRDGAETRAALQPLTSLVAGDASACVDERIKARRNQIGFLRAGIREDLDKKRLEREAAKATRVERPASGPRRKRGRTTTTAISQQVLQSQSSNGMVDPPEGGGSTSDDAPEPGRPNEEEEASDTETLKSVEVGVAEQSVEQSVEVGVAELEAPGCSDIVLVDGDAEPPAPSVDPAMSDTESSSSSASSYSDRTDDEEAEEQQKDGEAEEQQKDGEAAEPKKDAEAAEPKKDTEAEEQQAPSAPSRTWPPGSVYARESRRGSETMETIVAGTRYRFSVPQANTSLPPTVMEADVYAACQNSLYVYVPETDTVASWTPMCNWKWTAVGVVELDVLTIARMLRDAKKAWDVPPKLTTLLKAIRVPATV